MDDGFFIWLSFTLLFLLFVLAKPLGARVFLGFFFMVMALGVNLVIALSDPQLLIGLGSHSMIPFYRWTFQYWVAMEPMAFIIPIILFELAIGFLMLGKGASAELGLLGAMIFLVMIAPLNQMTMPNLVLALGVWLLLRRDLNISLPDILRRRRGPHHSSIPTSLSH